MARELILKKLGRSSKDKRRVEEFARAQYSLIMNEYLKAKSDTPAVEAFKENFRLYSEPRDFVAINEMLTKYIGLVFEQLRQERDPVYNAIHETALDAVEERMEGMMIELLNLKKGTAN